MKLTLEHCVNACNNATQGAKLLTMLSFVDENDIPFVLIVAFAEMLHPDVPDQVDTIHNYTLTLFFAINHSKPYGYCVLTIDFCKICMETVLHDYKRY